MSVRERIVDAGRNQWVNGPQDIETRIALTAAREALLIAKEQIGTHAVCVDEALSMCDDLLTALSDGTQGAETTTNDHGAALAVVENDTGIR